MRSGADESTSPLKMIEVAPPLRERVFDALEEIIVDGVFQPGAHLREDDLAKRLGVSRNPVREALQTLVYHGFADHQPGRGVFVHSPSMQEIEEVFHTRALLESESARLAAALISEARLSELDEILTLGGNAAPGGDTHELLELDERFHEVIIAAANNVVMAKMLGTLRRRMRWYSSSVVVEGAVESWRQHGDIVGALREGDSRSAARSMAAHVGHTSQMIQARGASEASRSPTISSTI